MAVGVAQAEMITLTQMEQAAEALEALEGLVHLLELRAFLPLKAQRLVPD
jgi:hypothetical protein